MQDDSISKMHKELEEELKTKEFGQLFLEFLSDFMNNKPDWIFTFAEKFNLDVEDLNNKQNMQFNSIFAKFIQNDNLKLVNIRTFSSTLIEVDMFFVKLNLMIYARFERKNEESTDLKNLFFSLSMHRLEDKLKDKLSREETVDALNKMIQAAVEKECFSGNILITENNETLFEASAGYASLSYKFPVNIDTKFDLGSMNKIFTAVSILQLYEQKKLDLQEPINKFLPDFPNSENITPHHLLSHTSGLGSFWNDLYRERFAKIRSIDDYLDLFKDDPLLFEPGKKFQYSNSGYIVLGKIIEIITGLSYDDYVEQNIHSKIDMKNTSCFDIDSIIPNRAMGYTHSNSHTNEFDIEQLFNNFLILPVKGSSAGGGYSTVTDLTNFAKALEKGELISEQSLKLMKNPHLEMVSGNFMNYGYGCQQGKIGDIEHYGHGGGANGVATNLMIIPDQKMIVVILTNYDPAYGIIIGKQIIDILERYLTE
jgi:CubicO group peptidase (beta-lactamase class C family)